MEVSKVADRLMVFMLNYEEDVQRLICVCAPQSGRTLLGKECVGERGACGVGETNFEGRMLLEFCLENKLHVK